MSRIRSRLPESLRWRLAAWVAAVLVLSTAAIFVVVYEVTGSKLRGQIDHDLGGQVAQLSQSLGAQQPAGQTQLAAFVRRYLRAQPYTATSRLLFVLLPGHTIVSNHPELFTATGPEPGETLAEQAGENVQGQRLLKPRLGYSTRRVPDVGRVRILERAASLPASRGARFQGVVVGAGEPLAAVERAQHGVAIAFAIAAAVAFALALLASYLVGVRVSAPLRRMASVAARVDAGELEPRMEVSPNQRGEVRVLGESFNHMLDRLAEAFAGQREFIADASHELRTPVTVIRGQLEVLAAADQPSREEVRRVEQLVGAEITRITRLIDDLLVLAQAERGDFLRLEKIEVRRFVEDLWDGVSATAARRFELVQTTEGTLRADPDRLAQALRNLARNAIEHTSDGDGMVRLLVDGAPGNTIRFSVVDDGPGIPPRERERVFMRFHRTDPGRARAEGGAGLGLAIVRAIAEAHGGQVAAHPSYNGRGARVELLLPGFQPA